MTSIEERIVSLGLNNSNFEKHAATSLKTLEKLDTSLRNTGTQSGLENMESMLEKISGRFSAMGIVGDQVIRNITNQVMGLVGQMGNLVKSMSIDQVTAGWSKYGDKTSAVQTIMAATAKDWADTGAQMEYVNGQLEKLNWFTDETSYSFLDMVNNIGKFTSNGIGLEESVTAMEGISTWSAISGANIQEAGRAMYNLSQAMATGSVKLIDWKSIENANMATREFKDTALETAVALGTLTKNSDGTFKTLQGHDFTAEQFNIYLSDAWFSSDVLMSVLNKYGSFTDKLNEATEATGTTASEFLEAMGTYKEGGEVAKELIPWIQELSKDEYELGLRSFKAAQEAKTFKDAIDATKDAVSTGWMKTFEIIFGSYQDAKKLWTGFANVLYDIFAEPGNKRNEFLEQAFGTPLNDISKISGRELFGEGLMNTLENISNILGTIGDAYDRVFGSSKERAEGLYGWIERFHDLTERMMLSEDALKGLENTFTGFFTLIQKAGHVVAPVFRLLWSALKFLGSIGNGLLEHLGAVDEFGDKFSFLDWLADKLDNTTTKIENFVKSLLGLDEGANTFDALSASIGKAAEWIGGGLDKIRTAFRETFGGDSMLGSNLIKTVGAGLMAFFGGKWIIGLFNKEGFLDSIKGSFTDALENISGILENVGNAFQSFANKMNGSAIKEVGIGVALVAASLVALSLINSDKLGQALLVITGGLGELILTLGLLDKLKIKGRAAKNLLVVAGAILLFSVAMIAVAGALVVLSLAVKIMSSMEPEKMWQGVLGLVAVLASVSAALFILGKFVSGPKMLAAGVAMIAFAAAMLIMVAAVAAFAFIPKENLIQGMFGIAAALIVMIAAVAVLGEVSLKAVAGTAAMLILAGAMVVVALAIALLGMIPSDKIVQGIGSMAIVLIAMVGALALLSMVGPMALVASAAMLVLSVALVLAAGALVVMAMALNMIAPVKDSIVPIAGGLAVLGAALLALGIGGLVAGLGIAGAAAMVVFGIALNTLVGIDIAEIAGGIALLGAALIPLGIGGIVLGLGAIGLIAGAVAIKMLGEGLPYLALGIQAFSEVGFWDLAKMFGAVASGIGKLMDIDTSAAANLITIGDGLSVIATSIAQIPENAKDILINLKTGITNNKGKPAEAITEVANSMIEALQTRQTDFLAKGQEISNAVADGVSDNHAGPSNAVVSLLSSMQSVLNSAQGNWRMYGWNISVGIANGINSGSYLSVNAITNLTNAIQNRLRSEMDINSPSRVMERLGGYIDEGLAQGIQNGSGDIENGMITAISPAIAILSALQSGDYDIAPTIRPVMDLSDISDMRSDVNDIYMGAAIRNLGRMGDFNVDGASINYGLQNRDVVSQVAALSEKLDALGDAIVNMQVVLDSGELVGATSTKMDNQLGLMAMRKGRGN